MAHVLCMRITKATDTHRICNTCLSTAGMFTRTRLTITFTLTLPFFSLLFVDHYLDLDEITYLNEVSVSLLTIARDVKIL